jgi:hypothetical protein
MNGGAPVQKALPSASACTTWLQFARPNGTFGSTVVGRFSVPTYRTTTYVKRGYKPVTEMFGWIKAAFNQHGDVIKMCEHSKRADVCVCVCVWGGGGDCILRVFASHTTSAEVERNVRLRPPHEPPPKEHATVLKQHEHRTVSPVRTSGSYCKSTTIEVTPAVPVTLMPVTATP